MIPARAALLAPGAGSSSDHPTLLALAEAITPLPVRRFDFPYRLAGKPFPDKTSVLVDCVLRQAEISVAEAGISPEELLLAGRSMGGRMCSIAVAEGLPAAGLVLIGYPLHPPNRPERLRVEHFPLLSVPCLFVSGTRDSFASQHELTAATAAINGDVSHRWIEGGRHELNRKADQLAVVEAVLSWLGG